MESTEFGIRLAKIRKEKGLTQEGLAQQLGISAQAVSKWEKGSYPDGMLLPRIAKCLDTSLDVLYGLKEPDKKTGKALEEAIIDDLRKVPEEERIRRIMELCYAIECSYYGYANELKEIQGNLPQEAFSEIRTDRELSLMRLNENLQYFYIMRIPEDGVNSYLKIDNRILELFHMLSQEDYLKVLYYFASGKRNHMQTKKKLVATLKIEEARISEIIDKLDYFGSIWAINIETEDRQEKVYGYTHNAAFPMLMAMAKAFITCIDYRDPGVDIWTKGSFRAEEIKPEDKNI